MAGREASVHSARYKRCTTTTPPVHGVPCGDRGAGTASGNAPSAASSACRDAGCRPFPTRSPLSAIGSSTASPRPECFSRLQRVFSPSASSAATIQPRVCPPCRGAAPTVHGDLVSWAGWTRRKEFELLIEAFASLPATGATLAIAGEGPDLYTRTLRSHSAGQANITFVGRVEPASFFQHIDVLVIPSVWEDRFPRVFHEALAFGVPSLVTPLGGLPEAIDHGRTGLIAAAATSAALRDSMLALIAGAWDFEAMRMRCRVAAGDYEPTRIVSQVRGRARRRRGFRIDRRCRGSLAPGTAGL